jgi:hypothetical protein
MVWLATKKDDLCQGRTTGTCAKPPGPVFVTGINRSAIGKRDIELLLPTTVRSLEDTLCDDTLIESIAMTPEISHNMWTVYRDASAGPAILDKPSCT